VWPGETASTLRQSVARRNSELPSPDCALLHLSFSFSPPLGLYESIQPSAEGSQAKQRAPFARVWPGGTASTLRQSIQPSAECSQAKQRAPFASVWPGEAASTLRQSVARRNSELPSPDCALLRLSSFFSPPLGLYESIQPSAECSQTKQRAPFASVWPGGTASTLRQSVARRDSELPSPDCALLHLSSFFPPPLGL
jgi:hypothetical protein